MTPLGKCGSSGRRTWALRKMRGRGGKRGGGMLPLTALLGGWSMVADWDPCKIRVEAFRWPDEVDRHATVSICYCGTSSPTRYGLISPHSLVPLFPNLLRLTAIFSIELLNFMGPFCLASFPLSALCVSPRLYCLTIKVLASFLAVL